MKMTLQVDNGDVLTAVRDFLRRLLVSGAVEALLVPMRTPYGTVAPALVTDPQLLEHADPLAPVLPVNAAALAGKLSAREPRVKVGVVLRSCELRALTELVKLQQASLDSLVRIAVDCPGAFSVPAFNRSATDDGWRELFVAESEPQEPSLRHACQICEQPVFDEAEISLELFGHDLEHEIGLQVKDEFAQVLGLLDGPPVTDNRSAALEKLIARRIARRDADFAAIRSRLDGEEGLPGVFAACIRCHNCMTACPICYCKTCVFKSPVFDHEPMQFIHWAKAKGALRMPSDTVLFHLTRLNHMVLSCVGCGACTEACPAELPVGLVFRAVGQKLQATFEYAAGRNPEEALPLVTFKADEWNEVGE